MNILDVCILCYAIKKDLVDFVCGSCREKKMKENELWKHLFKSDSSITVFDSNYDSKDYVITTSMPIAYQCDSCGFRRVTSDHKVQDSICEKCNKGKMKSKDFETGVFQDESVL